MEMSVEKLICGHLLLAYEGEFTYNDLKGNLHLQAEENCLLFSAVTAVSDKNHPHNILRLMSGEKKKPI